MVLGLVLDQVQLAAKQPALGVVEEADLGAAGVQHLTQASAVFVQDFKQLAEVAVDAGGSQQLRQLVVLALARAPAAMRGGQGPVEALEVLPVRWREGDGGGQLAGGPIDQPDVP